MRWAALGLVALPLVLAGCTPTVTLTPAPAATSTGCANVIVRLPDQLGDLQQRNTDAQGTAAWGPDPAVTLVCGVPETVADDRCVQVDGVDWSSPSRNPTVAGRTVVVFTTYGREPVVQLVSPVVGSSTRLAGSDLLDALSDAVQAGTRATGARCGLASPGPTNTHGPGPAE